MLQSYFLKIHESNKTPYRLVDDAQIEPASPEDPEELYRMELWQMDGQNVRFDVVFYPDRAEILGSKMNVFIGEIPEEKVDNSVDVAQRLEALKPHIVRSVEA